jgi:hypothetical protein
VLDGGGWLTPRLGRFTPWKDTLYPNVDILIDFCDFYRQEKNAILVMSPINVFAVSLAVLPLNTTQEIYKAFVYDVITQVLTNTLLHIFVLLCFLHI